MARRIESVAVIGAGTMGAGIAALCANAGCRVLLLDVDGEAAARGKQRLTEGRAPALGDPAKAALLATAGLEDGLGRLAGQDWICEAVYEDLATKRALFARIEPARREGSLLSTNTSGIPLRAITEAMPERLRRDIAVTHFFNPVAVMRLVELVPGEDTAPEVLDGLEAFLGGRLGKGVVRAKDTVNFIANRIGCFYILAGLDKAEAGFRSFLTVEEIDALLGAPLGLPATGLFGLVDLIGLDVVDLVARNLDANLPPGDAGRAYVHLPPYARAMLQRGQLGRKSGGGFYRMAKAANGGRAKEVYEIASESWRAAREVPLGAAHQQPDRLLFADDPQGRFVWDVMAATLAYAADLVPEIADDVVSVDRAMRWGYGWRMGPFELLDAIGPERVARRLEGGGLPLPAMLALLRETGGAGLYRAGGREFLALDGTYRAVPAG